jgi:two-component system CheB/CheR fusion protein
VDRGVVVIDREFRILLWNDRATDLWGLRSDEVVGRSLFGLDIGLPVEDMRQPIQEVWLGAKPDAGEITLDATNRRGKAVRIRVSGSLSQAAQARPQCLVLLMEEEKA